MGSEKYISITFHQISKLKKKKKKKKYLSYSEVQKNSKVVNV